MTSKDGIVVKGIGGFYYVKIDNEIIEAKGKGVLKKDGFVLAVGDKVSLSFEKDVTPVIEKVYPRKNEFIRPPICNVDSMILTFAPKDPAPNYAVIDKLLIMGEKSGIEMAICVNKIDLVDETFLKEVTKVYEDAYPIYYVSGADGQGIDQLKEFIKGKTVALAGASGVGKSTIINCLKEENLMETGEISQKTSRGRHTTRHVELFSIENGGMIFDTPGFSSYELYDIPPEELINCYPDVLAHAKGCKYDNCRHIKEPDCAVRSAVRQGRLNKQRYLSYKNNYLDLLDKTKY